METYLTYVIHFVIIWYKLICESLASAYFWDHCWSKGGVKGIEISVELHTCLDDALTLAAALYRAVRT